jgi:hypothetical protein
MTDRPSDRYRIGMKVPMPPKPKLRIVPAYKEGETSKSLRGAFSNGRGGADRG